MPATGRARPLLRYLVRGLLVLLLLPVLLLAGLLAYAQTGDGKARLAGLIETALAGPNRTATVQGLEGFLPFDIRLAEFALADGQGTWLAVHDLRLAWAPRELLRGTVAVEAAGARAIELVRLPPAGEPAPPSQEPFSLPRLPELPRSLPRLRLDRLYVEQLALGQAVLGEAATFALEAAAGTGDAAQVRLDLRRTDQPTASATLDAALDLAARQLHLDLEASETGGLLAALSHRPEAGDLTLALAGDGPLADWHGRLSLEAQGLATAGLGLDLALAEQQRLALDGAVDLAPGLLPPDLAALAGPRVTLALAAAAPTPQRFALERLDLAAAAARLTGTGTADLAADTLAGTAELTAPDLAPLAPLAGLPLAGSATLRLDAGGRPMQPELHADLALAGLAADALSLDRLAVQAALQPLAPIADSLPPLRLSLDAVAEGAALQGRSLTPGGRLDLTVAGGLPEAGPATLDRLELRSPLLRLDGQGAVDPHTLAGTGRLDAALPDLAAAAGLAAPDAVPDLAGSLHLGVDLELAEQARELVAVLDGEGAGLRLPPGLDGLVGPAPTLAARATLAPGQRAQVAGLELAGAGLRLTGEASLGLAGAQPLAGGIRLALPDLAPLQAMAGQPVSGALDLAATLGGTLPAPDLRLDATGTDLAFGAQRLDRLTLAATAAGPVAQPAGQVRLEAVRAGQPVTLASDYRLADGRLALTALSLTGPATRLAGGLDLDLAGPLATGRLQGGVGDLAALAPWHGQDLAGSLDLDLQLTAPQGRQDASLGLGIDRLGGGFGRLQSARLDAAVRDALGRPELDTRLTARGFAAPSDLTLDEASLSARGPLSALAIELAASGEQAQRRLDLRSAATVDALGEPRTVRLTVLDGSVAGERLRLTQPARLSLGSDGAVALDRLALGVGAGTLIAGGKLGGGRVQADLDAKGFPLGMIEGFGGPSLRGAAAANLALSGTTAAPVAKVQLRVDDFALDPQITPKPDLLLKAELAGGRLTADASLSELGSRPVTARLALPAQLALEPFAFTLSPTAPLDAALDGQVELTRVARVAALQGLQLAGSLQLALTAGGTLQAPSLGGQAKLSKGVLQEIESGVNLRNIELTLEGQGRRVAVTALSAADRASGRLTGTGWAGLDDDGAPSFAAELQASTLRVLDNSLGRAVLSGKMAAAGTGTGADVTGKLTLDSADIAIPDATGPSVPVMAVSEVNTDQRSRPEPAAAARPVTPPYDLGLGIAVDVPARLFVRGRGLDSEWGGKLTISGKAAAPEIVGSLEFRRGFLDLLDKRFSIDSGTISFVGSTPPIPMINLEASTASAEIKVVVKVVGPAADPKITLTSEPVLPQDEILSRLLFGTSVTNLTPMQGLRLAAAVNTLQGGSTLGDLLSAARRGLGLDTLDVQGGDTAEESSARAGKYVTDRVYLEVERGVAQGTGKARAKIDLTRNLSFGTEVNEQSQTGVGLEWRFDY